MHSLSKQTKKIFAGAVLIALVGVPSQFALAQFTATSTNDNSGTGSITPTSTSSSPTTPSTGTGGTGTGATPGVPNTGAGGDATTNLILLGLTGLIGASGLMYLGHRRASTSRISR